MIKKVLASVVVIGLFTIGGFSQQGEQKNPKAVGQVVLGESSDFAIPQTSASPAELAFTAEYSVADGGQNCHYLGFVQGGDVYRIDVRGLGGFDPVAMSIRAVMDVGNPTTSVGINDDCSPGNLNPCLAFSASGPGALSVCVRGFAGAGGRYQLRLDID
jgi:hypothetical protein